MPLVCLMENVLTRLYFTKYQIILGNNQKKLYSQIISKRILEKLNINTESNKQKSQQKTI